MKRFIYRIGLVAALSVAQVCMVSAGDEAAENTSKKARAFLLEHMPEQDKGRVSEQLLTTNIEYALKARDAFPWAKAVPEAIFFNDVLPYAILDERRDDWRGDFYARFKRIVTPAKTQLEAIQLINQSIKDELKVEYSTKRKKANQSPYESMETGMASCTGLSILLVDAFRSVGIPARVAGVPSWTTKNGNHNWVEVWLVSDQSWHFTEYYPDAKGLDHSWFTHDVKQIDVTKPEHRLYASSWEKSVQHFPMVWAPRSKAVAGVDVTERYLKPLEKEAGERGTEYRVEARQDGQRVPLLVSFYAGDSLVFSGTTPKRTDDANLYLTFHSKHEGMVRMEWKDGDGVVQSKPVEFIAQKQARLIQLTP